MKTQNGPKYRVEEEDTQLRLSIKVKSTHGVIMNMVNQDKVCGAYHAALLTANEELFTWYEYD